MRPAEDECVYLKYTKQKSNGKQKRRKQKKHKQPYKYMYFQIWILIRLYQLSALCTRFNWVFAKTVGCHLCKMFVYYYLLTHTHIIMQITNSQNKIKQSNIANLAKRFPVFRKQKENGIQMIFILHSPFTPFLSHYSLCSCCCCFSFHIASVSWLGLSGVPIPFDTFHLLSDCRTARAADIKGKKIRSESENGTTKKKPQIFFSNALFAIVLALKILLYFFTNFCTNFPKPK